MHSSTEFPPSWYAFWDFQEYKMIQQRLLDHLSETTADSTVAYQLEVQPHARITNGVYRRSSIARSYSDWLVANEPAQIDRLKSQSGWDLASP